ncbi:MAG: YhcG family protein [Candidatus Obscuribacterales bacterium]
MIKKIEGYKNSSKQSVPDDYNSFFVKVHTKLKTAQMRAARAVNRELIHLYWDIGQELLEKKEKLDWGEGVVDSLAKDIKASLPELKGFSPRNLRAMRQFAQAYPHLKGLPVEHLPWGHNLLLLRLLDSPEARLWYAHKALEHGWSRDVLSFWVDSGLIDREGKAVSNFKITLPAPQSDLAQQTLKDPYNLDFLALRQHHDERELEDGLSQHIQKFLIELGSGFAFMGRQYPITVDNVDYFIDMLFYNVKLRSYFVIELKTKQFKPEFAGKLNFYLSAVDKQLRHPNDNPSVGMILCKAKNRLTVEYALQDINKPIGVSSYEVQLLKSLPEKLKGTVPTIEELELLLDRQKKLVDSSTQKGSRAKRKK